MSENPDKGVQSHPPRYRTVESSTIPLGSMLCYLTVIKFWNVCSTRLSWPGSTLDGWENDARYVALGFA
jgi:hypothetical protein